VFLSLSVANLKESLPKTSPFLFGVPGFPKSDGMISLSCATPLTPMPFRLLPWYWSLSRLAHEFSSPSPPGPSTCVHTIFRFQGRARHCKGNFSILAHPFTARPSPLSPPVISLSVPSSHFFSALSLTFLLFPRAFAAALFFLK